MPKAAVEENFYESEQGTKSPTIDTNEIWKIALEQIKLQVSPQNYSAWFKKTDLSKIENGIATITCQSNYARDWLDTNHHQLIKNIVQKITKSDVELVFKVGSSSSSSQKEGSSNNSDRYDHLTLNPEEAPLFNVKYNHQNLLEDAQQKASLNPSYLFENFVVGPSNRLAHAAAEAVAENPGKAYNPLFLYGGVGLGKTHLIHAIGNRVLNRDPNRKILYCPSETFLNEMVEAIRTDKNIEFRQEYRELDVLIIDDIQFISNWEMAQTELFHTFNTLYQSNKQILFASDRPPQEIEDLTDRLRSRFQGGMVADISEPDYELRMAIIQQKARRKGIELPDNILNFIAKSFDQNIRELEGALVRIATHVKIGREIPTQEEIAKILEIDAESKRKRVSPRELVKKVCNSFNISVRDVRGRRRTAEIVVPRQVCMYLLRKELEMPLEKVAHELNRKDHTTVLHAIDRVEEKMDEDADFEEQVKGLKV
jgi:chromosomal replication initiator protein